jgi:adenylosuccinate synthase
MIADIVLGCSYGDEGKGKVIFSLTQQNHYDLCVRFNGSCNAGHTVYKYSTKYVLHSIPVGILNDATYCLISSDCVIDINKLKIEIQTLEEKGIVVKNRLFVSKACHIITPELIDEDKKTNVIGTTNSGNGPTYSRKMLRTGVRAENFENEFNLLGITLVDMREFWYSSFVKDYVKNVLFEGAQGFGLDINWTDMYPYCTSSSCGLGGAINTGIPLHSIRDIYGVAKAYDTYVGTYDFQPKDHEFTLNILGEIGKEFGSTTGRKRQCNFLNLNKLITALTMNSCNKCIINKIDIIEDTGIYKLYYDDKLRLFDNMEDFKLFIIEKLPHNIEVIFSGDPHRI